MAAPIASITISLVEDSHDEVSPYDAQFVCDNGTAKYDLQGGTSKQSGRHTMKNLISNCSTIRTRILHSTHVM